MTVDELADSLMPQMCECIARTGRVPVKVVAALTWGWGQSSDGSTYLMAPAHFLAINGLPILKIGGLPVETSIPTCPDCGSDDAMALGNHYGCADCGRVWNPLQPAVTGVAGLEP